MVTKSPASHVISGNLVCFVYAVEVLEAAGQAGGSWERGIDRPGPHRGHPQRNLRQGALGSMRRFVVGLFLEGCPVFRSKLFLVKARNLE